MTLAILSSLDLVVNKTVTIVTVAGTATTRGTLGNITPSETVITTNRVGTYRAYSTSSRFLSDSQSVLVPQETRITTNVNVGSYRINTTSSLYLAGTQAVLGPRETVVRATSNVGIAQKSSTPALGSTIATRQTVFAYGTRLVAVTDNNFQTSQVRANNLTNFFGNNRSYSGLFFDTVTRSVLADPLGPTSVAGNIFFNNLNYDYGNIVSNVASLNNQAYTTPGTYTFTVPAGVTSLSVVGVGGGGGGAQNTTAPSGGGGGMLGFTNNIAVTPGETFTVVVGAGGTSGTTTGNAGGATYTYKNSNSTLLLNAFGGAGGNGMYWTETASSVIVSDSPSSTLFYAFQAVSQLKQAITYSATGLPNGVTLNSTSGILGGDPDGVANTTTYNITVTATTSAQSISRQFSLIVVPVAQALGTVSNPAPSIAALRTNGVTTDGVYWFSTAKQLTPFQAYIRFNYIDGGDWALLLKVHNQGDLPSGSEFWTNNTLNNATDWNLTSGSWSKYATWNGIPFTRLMMVMTQNGSPKVPPIMIFNTSRTFAEAIALAGGSTAAATQNNIVKADSTDPPMGNSVTYWNMPTKFGATFTDVPGVNEEIMQAYGIAMWANNASNSTIAEGLPSVGRAGAWIGCPIDEGAHPFNNDSNTGADSGFGFGFAAGNPAKTSSAGYAEWTNASSTNTLPGYIWVR